jgi:hypothetical protein
MLSSQQAKERALLGMYRQIMRLWRHPNVGINSVRCIITAACIAAGIGRPAEWHGVNEMNDK